jgi:osmotically-inducible protein OsmY
MRFHELEGKLSRMEPTERRPDEDIEEEIELLIRSFAPLKASRTYFKFKSTNGHITVEGNVRSPQARRVLIDNIPHIRGVVSSDSSKLFDDEMVRVAVGQLLPPGVVASVHYGAVALTGSLPDGASADAIIEAVRQVPGVRRVGAEFGPGAVETPSSQKIEPSL